MDEVKVRKTTLDEYELDPDNVNAGSDEGRAIIRHSTEADGAGRSILVDGTGRVVAGNQTVKASTIREVIEVTTAGEALIVHRRADLQPGDPRREHLMIADNRASEVGLHWNVEAVKRRLRAGVDLTGLWNPEEVKAKFGAVVEQVKEAIEQPPTAEEMEGWEWEEPEAEDDGDGSTPLTREEKQYHFRFDLNFEDSILVDRAMKEFEVKENRDRLDFLVWCAERYLKEGEVA